MSGHIGERNRKGTLPRLVVTPVRRDGGGEYETCLDWCVLAQNPVWHYHVQREITFRY